MVEQKKKKDDGLKDKTVPQLRKLAKKNHVKQTAANGKTKNKTQLLAGLHKAGVKK
jgi:hypothetical protein